MTPDQRAMFQMAYSPNLSRATLKGDTARDQMADDLRVASASCGSVTDADLELLGWTPAQIATHGRDATRRAYARAAGGRA
jgi:hypothetical protein